MATASPASASSSCLHCSAAPAEDGADDGCCSDACYVAHQNAASKAYRIACIERELALDGFAIETAVWS